jgi:hypothetical protein
MHARPLRNFLVCLGDYLFTMLAWFLGALAILIVVYLCNILPPVPFTVLGATGLLCAPFIGLEVREKREQQRKLKEQEWWPLWQLERELTPLIEAPVRKLEQERDEALRGYWEIRSYLELRTEGVFTRVEFNKVRSLLHPDKAQSEAEQKCYAEAFAIFGRCEKLLKEEPLPKPPMPGPLAELMEARLRVKAKNRARGLKGAATRARKKPGRQLRDGR